MNGPETRESLLASLNGTANGAGGNAGDRTTDRQHDGWDEFTAIYRPLIYRVAVAKGLQHADAEDLTQDVLLVVRRSVNSYDSTRASFRSWLYAITRNLVVNHLTRRREPAGSGDSRIAQLISQQPGQGDTATLFRLEYRRACFQRAAEQAESEFHDDTWQAFWRTAVQQESIGRVAAELGKTNGAVRVARSRVLGRLRQIVDLQSGGFEPPD